MIEELLPSSIDKILNRSSWHVFQKSAGNLNILNQEKVSL